MKPPICLPPLVFCPFKPQACGEGHRKELQLKGHNYLGASNLHSGYGRWCGSSWEETAREKKTDKSIRSMDEEVVVGQMVPWSAKTVDPLIKNLHTSICHLLWAVHWTYHAINNHKIIDFDIHIALWRIYFKCFVCFILHSCVWDNELTIIMNVSKMM